MSDAVQQDAETTQGTTTWSSGMNCKLQRLVLCWQYGWLASVRGAVIEFALWMVVCAGIPVALMLMALGLGRITGWF